MDGATIPVAVIASRTEAELIVGLLRSHGLTAALAADDAGGEATARRLLAADDDAAGPASG